VAVTKFTQFHPKLPRKWQLPPATIIYSESRTSKGHHPLLNTFRPAPRQQMPSSHSDDSEIESDAEAEQLLPGFTFNAGQLTQMQENLHEYTSTRGKERTKVTVRVSNELRKEMEQVLGRKISDEQRHSLLEV
jgi:hypothetical protein